MSAPLQFLIQFVEYDVRIGAQEAARTAGSSDGPWHPWHLAKTPALNLARPSTYFASLGLPEFTVQG
jgi:hypothetical protein